MSQRRPDPRRGFTLIELLVVMSVIAILAGILLPILASARRQAKRAATKYTIAQVSVAVKQFSEDFGRFPPDDGADLAKSPFPLPIPPKTALTPPGKSPERLYFYLGRSDLSEKHPYLDPQSGVQTCTFQLDGSGRSVQPMEDQPQTNSNPQIADGWQHPIYYAMTAPFNQGAFDLWSGGPNLVNQNGYDKDYDTINGATRKQDDIRNW